MKLETPLRSNEIRICPEAPLEPSSSILGNYDTPHLTSTSLQLQILRSIGGDGEGVCREDGRGIWRLASFGPCQIYFSMPLDSTED